MVEWSSCATELLHIYCLDSWLVSPVTENCNAADHSLQQAKKLERYVTNLLSYLFSY